MRIIDCEQGSSEWFAARSGIPTGTDFADMITSVKGDLSKSSEKLIAELIDQIARPGMQEQSFTGNKHTERGKELEPQAGAWFTFMTGLKIQQVGLCVRDDGKVGCSPDYLVGAEGGLEIKCPDGKTHVAYLLANKLPDEYKQQVHGSMVVTGRRWWYFLSFCHGYKPLLIKVHWNDYTDKVSYAISEFLDRLEDAKAIIFADNEVV